MINAQPGGVFHIHINERETVGGESLLPVIAQMAEWGTQYQLRDPVLSRILVRQGTGCGRHGCPDRSGSVKCFFYMCDSANEPGRVVLVFESASEEEAREALATLPFAQLHLIDFNVIPLAPFYGLEHLSAPRS